MYQLPDFLSEAAKRHEEDKNAGLGREISLLRALVERTVNESESSTEALKLCEKALLGLSKLENEEKKRQIEAGDLLTKAATIELADRLVVLLTEGILEFVPERHAEIADWFQPRVAALFENKDSQR